jgi:hypothetical protein
MFGYKQNNTDDRFFPVTWTGAVPEQKAITNADIREIARYEGIPFANLKAVLDIEAAGSGFLLNEPAPARPKILFEAHVFYRETPKPVSKTRPDLSSRRWNRKLYKGGSAEWDRLKDAMAFDELAALRSASWGLGQVMGFNYSLAGCTSVEQFVVEAFTGEKQQFQHVVNFIRNTGLKQPLVRGDWHGFARGYNGSGYAANNYHNRLASAARKYA